MPEKKFHEFLYRVEDWVAEFAIAALSFGVIFALLWSFIILPQKGNLTMQVLAIRIEPWVTMLALMIIARELWLMNLHNRKQAEGE